MRHAASVWERDFVEKLAEIGTVSGKSSPVVFHDSKTGVRVVVHGDDFAFLGFEDRAAACETSASEVVPIEGEGHPERRCERQEGGGHPQPQVGLEYETDEHAQKVWSGCGLESMSKGLDTPSIVEDSGNHNEDDECLNPQEVGEFRGGQGQLLGQGPARHPVCDQGSVQVHVETNETLLGEIEKDRSISVGTSQSNHAIQERWKLGRQQGLTAIGLGAE